MSDNRQNTFFEKELEWLKLIIESRINQHFSKEKTGQGEFIPTPPELNRSFNHYSEFVVGNALDPDERAILLMSLAPHIKPHFLDEVITKTLKEQGEFPQIGGIRGKSFRGFLPTVETALFILAGDNLDRRFEIQNIFSSEHFFARKQVIGLSTAPDHEPFTSHRLILDPEYIELFTTGKITKPRLSTSFPAQLITTEMDWSDLVLTSETLTQIHEIETWVKYNDIFLHKWGMKKKIKPGFRCLFFGPPGTGKTLTATLLGKNTKKDVFRIDLSTVISKYIGETEKNLSSLFDKAESKEWILFFDEADALFGKRTNIRDAHDKYANQEVSYLLQRIENHAGLVILASNFKSNIDEAFTRRFHSIIYFPFPGQKEREQLWKKSFPSQLTLAKDIDYQNLASKYELTGASIINVVQYVGLKSLERKENTVDKKLLIEGIRKEYEKEGKIFT